MVADDMGVRELMREVRNRRKRGNMRITGKIHLECAHCGKRAEADFDLDYEGAFDYAIERLYKASGFGYSPFTPREEDRVNWSDIMLCEGCMDEIKRLYDANLASEREFLGMGGAEDAV